jgi:hypothetical protein
MEEEEEETRYKSFAIRIQLERDITDIASWIS